MCPACLTSRLLASLRPRLEPVAHLRIPEAEQEGEVVGWQAWCLDLEVRSIFGHTRSRVSTSTMSIRGSSEATIPPTYAEKPKQSIEDYAQQGACRQIQTMLCGSIYKAKKESPRWRTWTPSCATLDRFAAVCRISSRYVCCNKARWSGGPTRRRPCVGIVLARRMPA